MEVQPTSDKAQLSAGKKIPKIFDGSGICLGEGFRPRKWCGWPRRKPPGLCWRSSGKAAIPRPLSKFVRYLLDHRIGHLLEAARGMDSNTYFEVACKTFLTFQFLLDRVRFCSPEAAVLDGRML